MSDDFALANDTREQTKRCPGCGVVKYASEFSTMKCRNKIASHCRECNRKNLKIYNERQEYRAKKHAEYVKNKNVAHGKKLLRKFGFNQQQYNDMLERQLGRCAICGATEDENRKAFAVDHDHVTGVVRSLLCAKCNAAIGFLDESPTKCELAKQYLIRVCKK